MSAEVLNRWQAYTSPEAEAERAKLFAELGIDYEPPPVAVVVKEEYLSMPVATTSRSCNDIVIGIGSLSLPSQATPMFKPQDPAQPEEHVTGKKPKSDSMAPVAVEEPQVFTQKCKAQDVPKETTEKPKRKDVPKETAPLAGAYGKEPMTIKKREEATLKQRAALVLVISFVGAILMITSSLVPLPTSDDYRYVPPAAGAAASLRRISSGDKAASVAAALDLDTLLEQATAAGAAVLVRRSAAPAAPRERSSSGGRSGGKANGRGGKGVVAAEAPPIETQPTSKRGGRRRGRQP
ncbi:hypothetical protein Ctob_005956 [Chrysochromulina tobinii]|uniref:Uncharacterized protein n=1 Tax=Chrysochromulina tobinii TaxID=1460289 RepID=A0A0M0JKR3_9EUKA|nr:hypothetical protein Ctob_005956 [Chrysochromulina tobinii]|eukprot:KOO27176.1 hypothetical protein Ctob_005956 [Chrysochromulina sp. CCMP291]